MKYLLLCSTLLFFYPAITQTGNSITLEACYEAALTTNPLARQLALNERASALQLDQLEAGRLPRLGLQGRAQYQSENVVVPFEVPGQEPIELPLFVAQLQLEAAYTLYDGGATRARRQLQEADLLADQQETVSSLERLKQGINERYFALLLRQTEQELLEASMRSLEARRDALRAAIAAGAALPAGDAQLQAEILRLQARHDQAGRAIQTTLAQLNHLTGLELTAETELQRPELGAMPEPDRLERAELRTFELQQQQVLARDALIAARRRPQVGLFGQAGFGTPNPLNLFEERISPFGLVGLRFSWNILDWNHSDLERQQLQLQSQQIALQQDLFTFELDLREEALRRQITQLDQQLETDRELVRLESRILEQVGTQLRRGVATPADYIEQESRLTRARLQAETHRLEKLRAQVQYETEKGLR